MFRLWVGSLLGAFGSVWMVVVLHDGGSDDITSTGAVVDLLNLVVRTGWTTGRPFALKERRRRRTDGVGPGTTKSSLSHSMIATFFFAFGTSLNLGPPIMLDIRPVCWCACCTPPNSRVNMGNPGSMLSLCGIVLCSLWCRSGNQVSMRFTLGCSSSFTPQEVSSCTRVRHTTLTLDVF